MKILLVEDDYLMTDWLYPKLEEEFPNAEIDKISTESEFYSRLVSIAVNPPDIILMDVMLRWADPSPDLQSPPREVQEGGFFRAGLRCQRLLSKKTQPNQIPVVLFTTLE